MKEISAALLKSAISTLREDYPEVVKKLDAGFNLFDSVDSFALVNLLLDAEVAVEQMYGRYVPLADETIFDSLRSPFLQWDKWVLYVEGKLNAV